MVPQPEPPVCTLGPIPTPSGLGAQPQAGTPGVFLVQRDKLEALGVYLAGVQTWISEATVCLQTGAKLPAP